MGTGIHFGLPEVSSLDGFNRLAERCGWTARCDGHGRYYQPEMADVHAIWCANAGVMPPLRSTMTPRLLKPYLRLLMLNERVHEADGRRCYRTRLMGGEPAADIGDGTGKFFDEFLPAAVVPMWNAVSDAVLGHGGPVRIVASAQQFDRGPLVGELFAAPLLSDDGRADLILSAGRFNSLWRWDELLPHWEKDVAALA